MLTEFERLRSMFDIGCEVLMTSDGVTIRGYDYFEGSTEQDPKEHFAVERTYNLDFKYDEETGNLCNEDEYDQLLADIAKETNERSG
jgi:hypothetical protein